MSTQRDYEDYANKLTEPHRLSDAQLLRCVIIALIAVAILCTGVWQASAQNLEEKWSRLDASSSTGLSAQSNESGAAAASLSVLNVGAGTREQSCSATLLPGTPRAVGAGSERTGFSGCMAETPFLDRQEPSANTPHGSTRLLDATTPKTSTITTTAVEESGCATSGATTLRPFLETWGRARQDARSTESTTTATTSLETAGGPLSGSRQTTCGRTASLKSTASGSPSQSGASAPESPTQNSTPASSVALHQSARSTRPLFMALSVGFMGLAFADFAVSSRCIQAGMCNERGPLYRGVANHPLAFAIVKMGASSALAATAWSLRKHHPKAAWGVLAGLTVAQSAVVVWNSQQGGVR